MEVGNSSLVAAYRSRHHHLVAQYGGSRATVSAESLLCRDSIPTTQCVSSRSIGWSVLLLDVHSSVRWGRRLPCPLPPINIPNPLPRQCLLPAYSVEKLGSGAGAPCDHGAGTRIVRSGMKQMRAHKRPPCLRWEPRFPLPGPSASTTRPFFADSVRWPPTGTRREHLSVRGDVDDPAAGCV